MRLADTEINKFKQWSLACYPNEACGVVINGVFYPTKNTHEEPTQHFSICGAEQARLEIEHGRIEAILHSHPYSIKDVRRWPAFWPSGHDMQQWLKGTIPWGILSTEGQTTSDLVWLDDNEITPLIGRQFAHGIHDCYSLVRDWFRLERNITLPNYPRGMEWWEKGANYYEENFAAAGFTEISAKDATIGDCILIALRSPVIHHAAVITGSNEITHHGIKELSRKDKLSRWVPYVRKFVRYTGKQQQ